VAGAVGDVVGGHHPAELFVVEGEFNSPEKRARNLGFLMLVSF
jgi:hypothetical protein